MIEKLTCKSCGRYFQDRCVIRNCFVNEYSPVCDEYFIRVYPEKQTAVPVKLYLKYKIVPSKNPSVICYRFYPEMVYEYSVEVALMQTSMKQSLIDELFHQVERKFKDALMNLYNAEITCIEEHNEEVQRLQKKIDSLNLVIKSNMLDWKNVARYKHDSILWRQHLKRQRKKRRGNK